MRSKQLEIINYSRLCILSKLFLILFEIPLCFLKQVKLQNDPDVIFKYIKREYYPVSQFLILVLPLINTIILYKSTFLFYII